MEVINIEDNTEGGIFRGKILLRLVLLLSFGFQISDFRFQVLGFAVKIPGNVEQAPSLAIYKNVAADFSLRQHRLESLCHQSSIAMPMPL
ncbi:MAG: hypothetical protein WAU47_05250 [Desulfobaccales bacterium]